MEQQPRSRVEDAGPVGPAARRGGPSTTKPTLRRFPQEGKLKAFVRLGLLGAFIALAATVGIATSGRFVAPADAQIPAGVTVNKACNATTVPINTNSQCVVTIAIAGAAAPEPITIEARPDVGTGNTATGAVQFLDGVSGATGADVDTVFIVNPAAAATQALVIGCFGADCTGTIVSTEGYRCVVGGRVREFIQFGNGQFVEIAPSINCGPAQTTMAITCTPDDIAETGTSNCTATLTDNDVFPNTVSSGAVQLQLSGNTGATFVATGTEQQTIRCPAAGFNQPQGCSNVTFAVKGGVGTAVGDVVNATVTGTYTPDLATVNTGAQATATIRIRRQPVSKTWTKECRPNIDGVPNTTTQVRVGGTVTCTVRITGQAGETGNAEVTLTNAQFGDGATTKTFTCANTAPPAGTTCSFEEVFFPVTACQPMREHVRFRRPADNTIVLDFDVIVAVNSSNTNPGTPIEVLPKGTGTCQDVSKTWTKECRPNIDGVPNTTTQVRVGGSVTCTVRITGDPGEAGNAQVNLTNAQFGDGATEQTFTCVNTAPPGGTTCSFQETFFPVTACQEMRQRVRLRRLTGDNTVVLDFSVVVAVSSSNTNPGTPIEVLPKGTGNCQEPSKTYTKVCTPNIDGVPNTTTQVRVGGTVTCVVRITGDPGESGQATVELTNAIFPGFPANNQGISSTTFNCVNVAPPGDRTCSFTETFEPTVACVKIRERVIFKRFDGLTVLDVVIPVATANGVEIEVLPKGSGTCQAPSKTWTKTCQPQPDGVTNANIQVRVGNQVTCTVTITGDAGETGNATVTLTNATFATSAGSTQTFNCVNTAPPGGTSCSFSETFFPTDPPCQTMTESVVFKRFDGTTVLNFSVPVARSASSTQAPVDVIQVLPKGTGDCSTNAVASVSKLCTVQPDGTSRITAPSGTRLVRVGQLVTCKVTVTGTSGTPISGSATVSSPDWVLSSSNPHACVSQGGNPATCTFTETFFPSDSAVCKVFTQKVEIFGTSFDGVRARVQDGGLLFDLFVIPKVDTGVECAGGASTDNFAGQLAFICSTNTALSSVVGDPFLSPIPGQVRDNFIAGIGILPQALACKVIPIPVGVDPATCLKPFASVTLPANAINIQAGVGVFGTDNVVSSCGVVPGKIEVSSINGALIDLSGRLTTNLRIECGDISGVFVPLGSFTDVLPTINKNTCFGVTFGVAGLGVGLVDLNARYEPATFAGNAGAFEVENKAQVAFIAPAVSINLLLSPNPVTVGQTGTATARFNRVAVGCETSITAAAITGPFGAASSGGFCVDPTTGAQVLINIGSILNGSVVFSVADTAIASLVGSQPTATLAAPSSTAGFVTTANQAVVRCGFFPTTGLPFSALNTGSNVTSAFAPGTSLGSFFGGCESVSINYRGNIPGATTVSATFVPDLPGAFGAGTFSGSPSFGGLPQTISPLLGNFANAVQVNATRVLEVIGSAPSGVINLVRGCNNVTPTVSESVSAYAARVMPTSAVIAIWEHQAATNTFRGAPGPNAPAGAAAVADLSDVRRLAPVFVCVNAAATLNQPAV